MAKLTLTFHNTPCGESRPDGTVTDLDSFEYGVQQKLRPIDRAGSGQEPKQFDTKSFMASRGMFEGEQLHLSGEGCKDW